MRVSVSGRTVAPGCCTGDIRMRIRTGQLLNLSIGVPPGEQAVHDFCAANDHGTDLLAVDGFGCGRPGVADKGERSSRLGHPRPTSAKRNCAAARVRPV